MVSKSSDRISGSKTQSWHFVVVVISSLALGWSCQPVPATLETKIELVSWAWVEEVEAIMVVTTVEEADPFRTHGRLELSWLDAEGGELYRALYNTSQRANPVPPEAFGVLNLQDNSVESAGIEAYMEVSLGGFTLLTDSCTDRQDGLLSVAWVIRPPSSLTGPVEIRARVLPNRQDSSEWATLGTLETVDGSWRVAGVPAQSVLFEARLPAPFDVMLEEGSATEAIQELEELWNEAGDPRTIRAIRTRALQQIGEDGFFETGDESYALADFRTVYEWYLMSPDVLRLRVPVEGDLAPERLLYLAIAVGTEHAKAAREGGEYVMPNIDVTAAVANVDPWVVSAALFVARKQDIDLDIGDLLERWQGSMPWDETCSEQALLYLSAVPEADLAGMTAMPPEFAALAEVDPDGVEIQPWIFLSSGQWDPDLTLFERGGGLALEVLDSTMDPISKRSVDSDATTVKLSATRNYYSFRYLDGLIHGESRFIEGTAGTFVRMAVAVEGGV